MRLTRRRRNLPCALCAAISSADPGRGRFRDFVKTALYHLIVDFQSRRQSVAVPAAAESEELSAADLAALDRDFTSRWREEMLAKAWEALAAVQAQTGEPLHAAWRLRGERPDLKPDALATELGTRLGRPISARDVRQIVHRAGRNSPSCSAPRSAARWKAATRRTWSRSLWTSGWRSIAGRR